MSGANWSYSFFAFSAPGRSRGGGVAAGLAGGLAGAFGSAFGSGFASAFGLVTRCNQTPASLPVLPRVRSTAVASSS